MVLGSGACFDDAGNLSMYDLFARCVRGCVLACMQWSTFLMNDARVE